MSILLGFEIPTGARVEIPTDGHLAWFGQTQLSGKTTALEALVSRGGFKAIAFITKRGEGSFVTARTILPYFSEPTNDPEQPLWRWVASILEASQRRTMRFEESWIIKACEEPRHAKTLRAVYQNICDLLGGERGATIKKGKDRGKVKWLRKPVAGLNQGVYTSLKAYFDIVMPQLARLPYTEKLDLRPGLNVMDLRNYSIEMQSLVIRSVMEYVYLHERNTRVIIPEAQDFVPQGKNAPVKMACETMVRKGAADKNFMWLDSQDMAAVDKVMLRAVSIMGLGVQGQTHEIDRAIDHLFGMSGLKPEDIGRLKIGQFFVRLPGGDVKKVYVQPAWMDSELHAQAIARGEEPVSSAKSMLRAYEKEREKTHETQDRHEDAGTTGVADSPGNSVASLGADHAGDISVRHEVAEQETSVLATTEFTKGEGDDMWKEKYDALKVEFDQLREAHDALAAQVRTLTSTSSSVPGAPAGAEGRGASVLGKGHGRPPADCDPRDLQSVLGKNGESRGPVGSSIDGVDRNNLYAYIVQRAQSDPRVLAVLAANPEIVVHLERKTISCNGDSLQGKLARLISEKFFDQPRDLPTVRAECLRRGWFGIKTPNAIFSREDSLSGLVSMGFLTVEPAGYQAVPNMKVHIREAKA